MNNLNKTAFFTSLMPNIELGRAQVVEYNGRMVAFIKDFVENQAKPTLSVVWNWMQTQAKQMMASAHHIDIGRVKTQIASTCSNLSLQQKLIICATLSLVICGLILYKSPSRQVNKTAEKTNATDRLTNRVGTDFIEQLNSTLARGPTQSRIVTHQATSPISVAGASDPLTRTSRPMVKAKRAPPQQRAKFSHLTSS